MSNYLLKIEYDGTKFVGWQSQKNGNSIQKNIEIALKKILKKNTKIYGAGKKDKDFNAISHFATFRSKKKQDNKKTVSTASNVQVRKKVYKGSSQQWLKFKPFLNGAFDELPRI